jgi:hypothetical protein
VRNLAQAAASILVLALCFISTLNRVNSKTTAVYLLLLKDDSDKQQNKNERDT